MARAALGALGLNGLPRRRGEFVRLHRSLIRGAVEMLASLSERLALSSL